VHVTDLEVDVPLDEWSWRVAENVSETLYGEGGDVSERQRAHRTPPRRTKCAYFEALLKLLLLLVDDAESEVDFVGLLELGVHLENRGEGLLGVIERPIAVVQDADAVPQVRVLLAGATDA
jgi:hypothetical protein